MKYKTLICIIAFFLPGAISIYAQHDPLNDIRTLNKKLVEGETTISHILADTSLMKLHSLAEFREMIKTHAKPGLLTVISDNEPGKKIKVEGYILNDKGQAQANALLYFYHTSGKGWYADTGVHVNAYEGDFRHARLFGYLRTDDKGFFNFYTIKPAGYPRSDFAGHIHIQLWNSNNQLLSRVAGELQFEDDERMTPGRKSESIRQGYLISPNSGTADKPIYRYRIVVNQ